MDITKKKKKKKAKKKKKMKAEKTKPDMELEMILSKSEYSLVTIKDQTDVYFKRNKDESVEVVLKQDVTKIKRRNSARGYSHIKLENQKEYDEFIQTYEAINTKPQLSKCVGLGLGVFVGISVASYLSSLCMASTGVYTGSEAVISTTILGMALGGALGINLGIIPYEEYAYNLKNFKEKYSQTATVGKDSILKII